MSRRDREERRMYRDRERERRRARRAHSHDSFLDELTDNGGHAGFYRSRDGVIFGVCAGVAHYLDFSVGWLRFLVIVASLMTGVWPMALLYVLAALLMKPEPVVPFKEESDREFYDSYLNSRSMALHRLKRTFEALERRIRRIESIVTARDYDWDQRLNQ